MLKVYSDVTKKFYESADEAKKAEAEALKQEEEAKKAAETKKAERTARAKEVEKAYEEKVKAEKAYQTLLREFIKDYGSYHMTISDDKNWFNDIMDTVWNLW